MTINLSPLLLPIFFALCFAIYVGIVIVLITFSMRSRLKYAKRIQDAQARGAFDDLKTPEPKHLWLPITALIGVLGVAVSIGILLLQLLRIIDLPVEIMFIAFGIFGIMGATAGTLMYRGIDRKL